MATPPRRRSHRGKTLVSAPVFKASTAKYARPVVAGIHPRSRLFRIIDQARASQCAVWIAGPAGSGKTTLVSSYVEARDVTCVWCQVDSGDADGTSFLHHLSLAAKEATPRLRTSLPKLTPEHLADVPTFARNYFREFYRRLTRPFLLVLDDVHRAPSARFHEIVVAALEQVPPRGQVFLVSRSEVPETYARFRANRQMVEITWPLLRLTDREALAVVKRLDGLPVFSRRDVEDLHAQCEGWVAGLILIVRLSATQRSRIGAFSPSSTALQSVFDYFASEVFDGWSPSVRQFLMQTALFPTFTVSMAERLTGDSFSMDHVERLVRQHHFIERRADSDGTFQYHALFRHFLLEQALQHWTSRQSVKYHHRAATILEEVGQPEEALAIHIELGDTESAERLVLTLAVDMASHGRLETLGAAISRLPADVVNRSGWLQYWAGVCRLPCDQRASRQSLEGAYARFEEANDRHAMLMTVVQIVESYFIEQGTFEPLDRWIAVLDHLVDPPDAGAGPSSPLPEALEPFVAMAMLAALMYRQPERPDIDVWVDRALAALLSAQEPQLRALLGFHLLLYLTCWRGNLARAEVVMEALRSAPPSASAPALTRIVWHTVAAYFEWISGLFIPALRSSHVGLDLAAQTGVHGWDSMLLASAASASMAVGRLSDAGSFIARMGQALVPSQTFSASIYHGAIGNLALWQRDISKACEEARISSDLGEQSGTPYARCMCAILSALAESESTNIGDARRRLRIAEDFAARTRSLYVRYLCLLAGVRLMVNASCERERIVAALRMALVAGREGGFVHHLWMPPHMIVPLYAMALREGIEVEYVQEVIRRRGLVANGDASDLETWPRAVTIRTFGRFDVQVWGTPLRFPIKAQKKPLELLKLLTIAGSRGMSQDALADALWPDADAGRAAGAMATTLHRLRRLIGPEVIGSRGGVLALDPRQCWVDAWDLDRRLAEWERAGLDGAAGVAPLLHLYRGPFLPGDDQPWAVAERERVGRRVLRALGRASEQLQHSGRVAEAIAVLEVALDIDPTAEAMYRALMRCLLGAGHVAEALSVYERCRRNLASILSLRPSPETEEVRRAVESAARDLHL